MTTKGAIVFFTPPNKSKVLPAVVMRVYADATADLHVFDDGGADGERADSYGYRNVAEGAGAGKFVTS